MSLYNSLDGDLLKLSIVSYEFAGTESEINEHKQLNICFANNSSVW